ncbi:flagellar biosynthetic protein FliR [Candidatus Uabimicrobium amorphum]|uniref:Flagellar biosynthetic protein FliR n=1 Tax=Uabimicrobium amorphum TaxID=2596890 RepID=A0A5S9IN70_UABAM|nr:flagellar biosynthetic protein FliR [Candidatus Uabimicrobium amorphum]BBM85003.1 flagellar biosynthetic protein FliR [Candidatus Uabimicrobium amorphum]
MELSFTFSSIIFFVCVLLRISSFLVFFPFFPTKQSAKYAKIFLCFVLAVVITAVMPRTYSFAKEIDSLFILFVQEIATGAMMGFVVFLLGGLLRMVGGMISQLAGLEIVQTIDPGNFGPSSLMANFIFYYGVFILILFDAHHYLLQIIVLSFEVIPPGSFHLSEEIFHLIHREWIIFCRFTLILVAPFLLMGFTISIELGILSRLVPQMNVFLMEYPIRLGISIFLLAWFLPSLTLGFANVFNIVVDVYTVLLG